MTSRRLATGGLIGRDETIKFTLGSTTYAGFAGDTVASAALANGIARVGDSIYLRRPRGVMTCGVEEPNAFVRVEGGYGESMLPATTLELADDLQMTWEDGIGTLDQSVDDAEYDHMHVHTDVAIVGAGPAGLSAARAAVATGVRVTLLEQDFALGGSLLGRPGEQVEGRPAHEWVQQVRAELEAAPNCRILLRTSVFGSYDNNYLVALEKRTGHLTTEGMSRQRVWHLIVGRVVLATGSFERSLIFAGNDRPGVMLASAAQAYLGRFGVLVGERVVVFTTNDSAYPVAADLAAVGATVTVLDARPSAGCQLPPAVDVRFGMVVVETLGDEVVTGVRIASADGSDVVPQELECDLLAVSGGWSPNVSLHSQRQGALRWDERLVGFVPTAPVARQALAGAVLGTSWTEGCLSEGAAAGADEVSPVHAGERADRAGATADLWLVPGPHGDLATHFVDPQRDNTAADVVRAVGAGMRSVEHVKRYTSISTGLDQGKIGGVLTIGLLTQLLSAPDMAAVPAGQPGQVVGDGAEDGEVNEGGRATNASMRPSPGALGTTTFRAPFTPVAFVALAGRSRGQLYDPARLTPSHGRQVELGARFEDVGQWKRAWYFARHGEDMDAAVARECRAARENVAYMDATTLGKIEVRGADAATFLNRIYTNAFAKLAVGKQRYGVMCRPDGMVFDDGVTFRLADDRFVMTTTTGGAARVLEWLEEWSQTEWPDLDVWFTSVTEQWTTIAVVGPRSRQVVAALAPDLDVSKEGFEFMAFRDTTLASGIPARIARVTFSGELAFEINVSGWYGQSLWDDVSAAGESLGITPYGTETMHVLRAEKAYPIVGQDTDGTVTPQDLGMSWVVSTKKEFVGKRSYERASHNATGRKQLVSLLPLDTTLRLPEGSQVIEQAAAPEGPLDGPARMPIPMIGHVTSSYHSQAIGRSFALALVKDGRDRVGQQAVASFGGRFVPVEIGDAVVYDKEGTRRDG
ncbi:FAD-dependent oxidoreductase [Allobranchiibius sp. CTAmp26]|uniref:FAD-dependent oxidoreductase n=1 Tax=Allobranchiibius sp. CTAmp26 TaxID=2815214 RepID=UPI001AA0C114|nr:FAD-dependent oxidoreductase [Allobranchiibius sp. CTAmp26]MBO1754555.1 (2Fe-2S)-binding protein [Allobranchiibius sp. CTAmp26]